MISPVELARRANELRENIQLGLVEPLPSVSEMIELTGHELVFDSFGDSFSGALRHLKGDRFLILINRELAYGDSHVRFTLAHELGHISCVEHLAHMIREGKKMKSWSEFRSDDVIEREADQFAAFFLAPTPMMNMLLDGREMNIDTIRQVANYAQVSILCAAYRCMQTTDLPVALILSDSRTGKIRQRFHSAALRKEKIGLYDAEGVVPRGGLTEDIIRNQSPDREGHTTLSLWYPHVTRKINCLESCMSLGYNNTIITVLTVTDDLDDEDLDD